MRLRNRIRYLARRRRLDADLAEELRLHREMAENAALRAGATPEGARREANLAFGSEAIALEDSRAVWRFAWIESVAQDGRGGRLEAGTWLFSHLGFGTLVPYP